MTLTEIANSIGCDKGTTSHERHGYTEIYSDFVNKNSHLLEIGIDAGLSVQMWRQWSPSMRLIAIDNRPECITQLVSSMCDARVYDQSNHEELATLVGSIGEGTLDVIIDDGSHRPDDQLLSIVVLFNCLKPDEWYENIVQANLVWSLVYAGFAAVEVGGNKHWRDTYGTGTRP